MMVYISELENMSQINGTLSQIKLIVINILMKYDIPREIMKKNNFPREIIENIISLGNL